MDSRARKRTPLRGDSGIRQFAGRSGLASVFPLFYRFVWFENKTNSNALSHNVEIGVDFFSNRKGTHHNTNILLVRAPAFFFYVSRGLIPFTMTMVFGGLRTQIQLIMSHLNDRMYFWLLRERVYYFPYVWTKVGHDEAIFTLSCP